MRSFDVKGKQIKGEKKAIKLLETFEYLKSATTRLYDTEDPNYNPNTIEFDEFIIINEAGKKLEIKIL